MFGTQNKKLFIKKELKDSDNYHLGLADASTYRFRSIELYHYLYSFFKIDKDKEFYLEMQDDFSIELTKIY